jgi:hypothetical protein
MRSAFRQFVLGLSLVSCSMPLAAQADRWKGFQFLIGEWTGGGGSSTGQGSGTFSFQMDVDGKVLMRRNHAGYPAAKDKPAVSHDDLMMIYSEGDDKAPEAVYADSEGHVIHYESEVSSDGTRVRFLSRALPGAPRYRLTYRKTGSDTLEGQFEVAPPGKPDAFTPYLTWTAQRKR